jgi:hypothetical protein
VSAETNDMGKIDLTGEPVFNCRTSDEDASPIYVAGGDVIFTRFIGIDPELSPSPAAAVLRGKGMSVFLHS